MVNPNLTVSQVEATSLLDEQIAKGETILSLQIINRQTFINAREQYKNWRSYNATLLNKIFDSDSISKGYIAYGMFASKIKSFAEEQQDLKEDILSDLEKLRNIRGRLSLYIVNKPILNFPAKASSQNKLQAIIYNPYTVKIVGGLIVALLVYLFANSNWPNNSAQLNDKDFKRPFYKLENYKIIAANTTFPTFDTLYLVFKFQGSQVTLNSKVRLINYNFTDDQYFYNDPVYPIKPELELLESFISNPILDSSNTSEDIIIQLKRKIIFEGYDMAWFNETDKKIIGDLTITFSYNYQDKIINDTLTTNIYIEKNKSSSL